MKKDEIRCWQKSKLFAKLFSLLTPFCGKMGCGAVQQLDLKYCRIRHIYFIILDKIRSKISVKYFLNSISYMCWLSDDQEWFGLNQIPDQGKFISLVQIKYLNKDEHSSDWSIIKYLIREHSPHWSKSNT